MLPIWQVDAFSSRTFGGNPAAVVAINGPWPDDRFLQAIAAENNLSETAFFRSDAYPVPLRWFTPAVEVPLCGHATLAAAAVMHKALGMVECGFALEFATRSGPIYGTIGTDTYVLEIPARAVTPTGVSKALLERAAGVPIREVWESVDRYVCVLDDAATVRNVNPDFGAMSELGLPGLIVTALSEDCDFVSRYFAPAKGVPEDPVTGTSHATLAPFWGQRLGKTSLRARQLSARGGEIACLLKGDRVQLTGACAIYMRGSISVPVSHAGSDGSI
jgi:PhzF family phenazine biosynthesis protein